jgi:hypothetical protein
VVGGFRIPANWIAPEATSSPAACPLIGVRVTAVSDCINALWKAFARRVLHVIDEPGSEVCAVTIS